MPFETGMRPLLQPIRQIRFPGIFDVVVKMDLLRHRNFWRCTRSVLALLLPKSKARTLRVRNSAAGIFIGGETCTYFEDRTLDLGLTVEMRFNNRFRFSPESGVRLEEFLLRVKTHAN